jgi:hypothetical protein
VKTLMTIKETSAWLNVPPSWIYQRDSIKSVLRDAERHHPSQMATVVAPHRGMREEDSKNVLNAAKVGRAFGYQRVRCLHVLRRHEITPPINRLVVNSTLRAAS